MVPKVIYSSSYLIITFAIGRLKPASVTTTRCQHSGCTFQEVYLPGRRGTFSRGEGVYQTCSPPGSDLGRGIAIPQKEPGTRHTHPPRWGRGPGIPTPQKVLETRYTHPLNRRAHHPEGTWDQAHPPTVKTLPSLNFVGGR